MKKKKEKKIIGWREWVALPDINIPFIKAKVDTGAKTSCLHAIDLKKIDKNGENHVKFKVHPDQRSSKITIEVEAKVQEYRKIKSSNGQSSLRPVIVMNIELMEEMWPIEITLTNRHEMGFRMLLGRDCFKNRMLVDAGKSYYSKKPSNKHIEKGNKL